MELNELIEYIKVFCEDRDWDQYHNPKDLAIGISTEAAELLDLFRFKNGEEIQETMITKKEHIEDELADVLFFVLRFAQTNNIDLRSALTHKMEKNALKYPIEKVKGNNKKYNEY
ncbi:MAG: nucleotide pyrophosphohydrolase [Firmicutes bacterium HGW-Firmicutes-10]|jgi:NTP pyrophosphatase (non-canonical NTP hydrolase)|nr:MAG: nucleotide pyrophosphohydrolase [Firmicutes bacterium HGW-Firmicutes-10]